jgi:hypothetical protein
MAFAVYRQFCRDWHASVVGAVLNRCESARSQNCLLAPYSITSSAIVSSVCGISTPSFLAVLRLIKSSNWVGCSKGSHPAWRL